MKRRQMLLIFTVALVALALSLTTTEDASGATLAEWDFEEGSGTTLNDVSGHGETGTLYPAGDPPTWELTPDVSGNYGLYFDHTSEQKITFAGGSSSGPDPTLCRSWSVWFNMSSYDTGTNYNLIGMQRPIYNNHGLGMMLWSGKYLTGLAAQSNSNWYNNLKYDISGLGVDTWINAIFTVTGTSGTQTGRLYVQGVEVTNYTGTAGYIAAYYFAIAGYSRDNENGGEFWGNISQAAVYDNVLTPAEVANLYQDGLSQIEIVSPTLGAEIDRDDDKPSGRFSFVTATPTTTAPLSTYSVNATGSPQNDNFDITLKDTEENVFSLFLSASSTPYFNDTLDVPGAAVPGTALLNITNSTTTGLRAISVKDTWADIGVLDPLTGATKAVYASGDGVRFQIRVKDWATSAVLSGASVYIEVYFSGTDTLVFNNSEAALSSGSDDSGTYYDTTTTLTGLQAGRFVVYVYTLTAGNVSDCCNMSYFLFASASQDDFKLTVQAGDRFNPEEALTIYATLSDSVSDPIAGATVTYRLFTFAANLSTGTLTQYATGSFYTAYNLATLAPDTYLLEVIAQNSTHTATVYQTVTVGPYTITGVEIVHAEYYHYRDKINLLVRVDYTAYNITVSYSIINATGAQVLNGTIPEFEDGYFYIKVDKSALTVRNSYYVIITLNDTAAGFARVYRSFFEWSDSDPGGPGSTTETGDAGAGGWAKYRPGTAGSLAVAATLVSLTVGVATLVSKPWRN